MLSLIEFSFMCAVIGEVYTNYLTEPTHILSWWYKIAEKWPDWIFKPVVGCERCFTGQVALWLWLYLHWKEYKLSYVQHVFDHIFVICCSIWFVIIIHTLYKWIKKQNL